MEKSAYGEYFKYPRRSLCQKPRTGGGIDKVPPPWVEKDTDFYLGYDPEGNVFGVEADQAK